MRKSLDILIKCISLIFSESKLDGFKDNNSRQIIKKLLSKIKTNERFKFQGIETDIVENLKTLLLTMCKEESVEYFNKSTLVDSVSLIFGTNLPDVLKLFKTMVERDMEEADLISYVASVRRFINNKTSELIAIEKVEKTLFLLKNSSKTGMDSSKLLNDIKMDFENLTINASDEDEAINDEINFDTPGDVTKAVKNMIDNISTGAKIKSGYQAMNISASGGFSRGQVVNIAAMQHNNKSGTLTSLYIHSLLFNDPEVLSTSNKKPTMVLLSLEDDVRIVLKNIFIYLYCMEYKEQIIADNMKIPTIDDFDEEFIVTFVTTRLKSRGFSTIILRVDPSEWSYSQLFAKLMKIEKDHEIIGLFVDYLNLIPTTGCNTNGALGTDYRDLYRRVRNYIIKKNILFMTPAQLSSDAKMLKRNGTLEIQFVKELVDKGYYANSKQLDQEIDLEYFINICKYNGQYCQTFQRGKHRGADFLDPKKRYFLLPFFGDGPILPDIDTENTAIDPDKESSGDFDF